MMKRKKCAVALTIPQPVMCGLLFAGVILGHASAAAGLQFSESHVLNSNAYTDAGLDEFVEIATDCAGTWIAVWCSDDSLEGSIGTDADVLFSRSLDDGATWIAPAPLNTNAYSDSGGDAWPRIATDSHGTWIAVWTSDEDLEEAVGTDLDVFYSRSIDDGATWSEPSPLNENAIDDSGSELRAHVATDGSGMWVATWDSDDTMGGTTGADRDLYFATSSDGGLTWSTPGLLNTDGSGDSVDDYEPRIAGNGAGTWVTVWGRIDGPNLDYKEIYVTRSIDNASTWSEPAQLNTNGTSGSGLDQDPHLATDGSGNWVVVWDSCEDLGGTIGDDQDILYARSGDNGETWSETEALSTNAQSTQPNIDAAARVATDGMGTWVVVWGSHEDISHGGWADSDILFSVSIDLGVSWSDPAFVNSYAIGDGGLDWYPTIGSDRAGKWVVAWGSEDAFEGALGSDSDIIVGASFLFSTSIADFLWEVFP